MRALYQIAAAGDESDLIDASRLALENMPTCRDCSSVISSDAFIPFSVISLKRATDVKDRYCGSLSETPVPANHFAPAFPVLAPFETGIARDKLL